ncbi:MAG: hypothetical protein LBF64_06920 [Oscillospiraceae bacterium]|jgi:flagellin-like protein|nr:hypothetical protein [Oscillospiraceae bacterium]
MNNLLNGVWMKAASAKGALIQRAKHSIREERGGAEIVAVIILVAIVVLLAVVFRAQLGALVQKIWSSITGKAEVITKDFELTP